MWRHRLKRLRVTGALLIGGVLTLALVDFYEWLPAAVGRWAASIQLVPAAVALATGAGLAAGVVVAALLLLTLLFGRVYCSVICPLGILQDAIARVVAWLRGRPAGLKFAEPRNGLRYGFLALTLAGIIAGWGGLTLALLDPYSNYGRIASGLFRPVIMLGNNLAVGVTEWSGLDELHRVPPAWPVAGVLMLSLAVLVLVGWLAATRGRLFCNTVCPVGTLLGLVSRKAAWRLTIDRSACLKCGECLQVCKAQCIDLRKGEIDASRCVACYNCIGTCKELGIVHAFAWTPLVVETDTEEAEADEPEGEPEPEPTPSFSGLPGNPSRRVFLGGALAATTIGLSPKLGATGGAGVPDPNHSTGVCPPGAGSVDRYLNRCTACHLCVTACPTHVLQPAFLEYGFTGLLRPRMDFTKSFCNYDCRRCGEVCPDGAITLLDLADKQLTRIGVAVLVQNLCVVEKDGTDCAACSEHCPTKAVDTVPYRDGLRLPVVHPERCIGCGACEFSCPVQPVKAITVSGRRRHERAEKFTEEPPVAPVPEGEFPF